MMASIDSGRTPIRASLATVSRMPKPQSINTRVAPASTSRPLPSLPLPRQAKRTLLELILEQREDLVAVRRVIRGTGGILHRHQAGGIGLRHDHTVLFRLLGGVGLPELELLDRILEPTVVLLLLFEIRIRIADKIESLRTVAIDDGKASAIERESNATPRAVERVIDDQLRLPIDLFDARAIGRVGHSCHRLGSLRRRRAEREHQALEKFGLDLRIRGRGRPDPVFALPLRDLGGQLSGTTMADEDIDGAGLRAALNPTAKFVALVSVVAETYIFAGELLEKILRQVGAILGPIGFHDAEAGLVYRDDEPVLGPEILQRCP